MPKISQRCPCGHVCVWQQTPSRQKPTVQSPWSSHGFPIPTSVGVNVWVAVGVAVGVKVGLRGRVLVAVTVEVNVAPAVLVTVRVGVNVAC